MQQRPRLVLVPAAALLVTALAACDGSSGGDGGPADSGVDAVPLALAAPTYAAATDDGLLVRSGDSERVFPRASTAEWLPGGRALVGTGTRWRIWDPATDELGPTLVLGDPNRSVTQISVIDPVLAEDGEHELVALDLDGTDLWRVDLPVSDYEDTQDADDVERLYASAHTIDGATFLRWYDNSELEEYDGVGLLRVGPDLELAEVQEGEPLEAIWLAADGSALLASRPEGDDPCFECERVLVEIDPDDGSTLAEHALPDEYSGEWSIREVDKVGDRIAVRFDEGYAGRRSQGVRQHGTWVLDDDGWSMVPGSDEELSWWQGPDDRVVAVPIAAKDERERHSLGDEFTYWWEHDGERTRLPGLSELDGGRVYHRASVPGQLLAP